MLTDQQRTVAQTKVLEHIREGWSLSRAALGAGVTRQGVYKWRQNDPYFAEAYMEAWEQGTDVYEDILYKNAVVKEHPASVVYALKLRGRFSPVDTSSPAMGDSASTSVEALAAKAIERGYIKTPQRSRAGDA